MGNPLGRKGLNAFLYVLFTRYVLIVPVNSFIWRFVCSGCAISTESYVYCIYVCWVKLGLWHYTCVRIQFPLYITPVEFSAKVTFQGYRCIVESQEDVSSIPNKGLPCTIGMEQIEFDVEGIQNLLQNLKSKETNGPYNILTRLIKETASEISEVVFPFWSVLQFRSASIRLV